jgi:uncharacterized membrane protein
LKRSTFFLLLALFSSLFIYLFYRTEHTVVNSLFNIIFGHRNYHALKASIHTYLPLNEFIVFSLPEGLWVFCITLTSKDFYLKIGRATIHLAILPLIFVIGLEILQLFHITNGTFDFLDILTALLSWMVGFFLVEEGNPKQHPFKPINKKTIALLASYAIVYLAHVSK